MFKIISLFILVVFISSCSTSIELTQYVNKNSSFHLRKSDEFDTTKTINILPNSEKHNQLVTWLNENESGWNSSIASYISKYCLFQDNFRLLFSPENNAVVVGFNDKKNNPKQLYKEIKNGELDFLIK